MDSVGRQSITQPLLAYMVYALQSATAEHVRMVMTGHFTVADITDAKQTLWSHCGGDVIGAEMPRRRDSRVRSIEEAHVHDIITAMKYQVKFNPQKSKLIVLDNG